ncbi:MAG: hypothetical protein WA261_01945 [Candidatus Sulfotelmatobacter sp.]|jgi:hypothetical protein
MRKAQPNSDRYYFSAEANLILRDEPDEDEDDEDEENGADEEDDDEGNDDGYSE